MIAPLPLPAAASALQPTDRDITLTLWRAWNEAHAKTAALCRRQQRLETRLMRTVGFPRVEVHLPDEEEPVIVSWPGEIEEFFGDDPALADLRATAEADLAAQHSRWDEADARLRYSTARRAEAESARHEDGLANALCATPTASLAGVAANLDAIIQRGQWRKDCPEFPWPELRAVLKDVKAIGGAGQIE